MSVESKFINTFSQYKPVVSQIVLKNVFRIEMLSQMKQFNPLLYL